MTAFCPRFKLLVWKRTAPGTVVLSRVRCKMWTCDHCAKIEREMWSEFLMRKLPRVSVTWWFVTMTAHEYNRSAAASLANLRKGIDNVMKRARRVWGEISYVRIFEKHKNGAYHAHFIMCGLSDRVARLVARNREIMFRPANTPYSGRTWGVQTWFKRAARACHLGYMVHAVRLANHQQAVRYVVKYMTKSAQAFYAKGLRRIQTTVRIGSPRKKGDAGWTAAKYLWSSDMRPGENLVDLNTKEVIPPEYWIKNVVYPPEK